MIEKDLLGGIQKIFRAANDRVNIAIILSLREFGCWKSIEELRSSIGELSGLHKSCIDPKRLKNLEEKELDYEQKRDPDMWGRECREIQSYTSWAENN